MAGKIFVNYRRDDDPSAAARVRDGLAAKFGRANVFMDVDNLLVGQRFDQELAKALAACDVLVAIIGPRWLDLMKARAAGSERDYVREEIAGALQRKLVVIPVRVGREGQLARLPLPEDLPDDIRDLVLYQKHDVAHERFGRDIGELIEAIGLVRRTRRPQLASRRSWSLLVGGVAAFAFAGYAAAYYAGVPVPWLTAGPTASDVAAETDRVRLAAEAKRNADEELARRKAVEEVARRIPPAGSTFRDCDDGCPEMVVVPAGSFMMGSSASEIAALTKEFPHGREWWEWASPQRQVTITQPIAVGKFEVTRGEFATFVAATGHKSDGCKVSIAGGVESDKSWRSPGFPQTDRHPVTCVRWHDAKQYMAWLSRKTGKSYRLLSEAEWEYAARAGTTTPFSTGPTITTSQANFDGRYTYGGSAKGQYRERTVEVGSFPANQFGLHDMHGNVGEWVEDCGHDNYHGAPSDGSAWTTDCSDVSRRINRGGSWDADPSFVSSTARNTSLTDQRNYNNGFRVGRTL